MRGDFLQEDLAERLGVHKNTLASYEKGKRQPDAEYLNNFLAIFVNVNPTWLLTGKGEMLDEGEKLVLSDNQPGALPLRVQAPQEKTSSKVHELNPARYVRVPVYEIFASAGGGSLVQSEQVVDFLSFKRDWIKDSLGVPEKHLALISVKGDSMEPTLSDGDLVLIDISSQKIEASSIYVVQFWGALLVKRIQIKLDGSIIIKSDNPLYDPENVSDELLDQLHVIGRVIWAGRRM